jgi:hypothetical protein
MCPNGMQKVPTSSRKRGWPRYGAYDAADGEDGGGLVGSRSKKFWRMFG